MQVSEDVMIQCADLIQKLKVTKSMGQLEVKYQKQSEFQTEWYEGTTSVTLWLDVICI